MRLTTSLPLVGAVLLAATACVGDGFEPQAGDDDEPPNARDAGPGAQDSGSASDAEVTVEGGSGCTDDGDCDNGLYCDGQETCVAGDCQLGTPPGEPSGIECVKRVCDEAQDIVRNEADDSLCPAPEPACNENLAINYRSECHPQRGCEVVADEEPCAGGGVATTCEGELLSRVGEGCLVEDGVARCAAIEEVESCEMPSSCVNEAELVHVSGGACDPAQGACVTEQEICTAPAPECSDGVQKLYGPTCDPELGCGVVSEEEACPTSEPVCLPDGQRVSFTPACEGSVCGGEGIPTVEVCGSEPPRCESGTLTQSVGGCSKGECTQEIQVTPCPTPPNVCYPWGDLEDGFVYEAFTPTCESRSRCGDVSAPTAEICLPQREKCVGDVWLGQLATCSAAQGCGLEKVSEIDCSEGDSRTCLRPRNGQSDSLRVVSCTCSDGPSPCECTDTIVRCDFGCSDGRCNPPILLPL